MFQWALAGSRWLTRQLPSPEPQGLAKVQQGASCGKSPRKPLPNTSHLGYQTQRREIIPPFGHQRVQLILWCQVRTWDKVSTKSLIFYNDAWLKIKLLFKECSGNTLKKRVKMNLAKTKHLTFTLIIYSKKHLPNVIIYLHVDPGTTSISTFVCKSVRGRKIFNTYVKETDALSVTF